MRGIHRWPVNSPHKWPVARKMFPFDDIINTLHTDGELLTCGDPSYGALGRPVSRDAPGLAFGRVALDGVQRISSIGRFFREDVLQTSAPSMSPVEVWLYLDLKSIWSLASPRHYPSDWVSCPLATTRKWSVCTCRKLWKTFDFSKLLLYFFFFFLDLIFFIFLTVLYNSLELLYSTVS